MIAIKPVLGLSCRISYSVERTARPIFIVSPGRSGSTILTWCLGQHPNIVPQEESNWLGPFAIDAAVGYRRGSARGERGQLSSNFIQYQELLAHLGQSINDLILSHREQFESIHLRQRVGWSGPAFPVTRSPDEPKRRWADGTPENSFYICGLRKLFPQAVFVHLIRDVTDMVRSLLNFYPEGRDRLVANEQAAYEYWLRRTICCVEAEEAYGPHVVYRMRYSDIVTQPESAMRSLLDFLGEPYTPQCLEPLALRINSSNVSPDFDPSDPATDRAIVEQARQLSNQLQSSPQPRKASARVAEKLETEFNQRIEYFYDLSAKYSEAQQLIAKLQKECELLKTHQCQVRNFEVTSPD
jgi:sulfotransferase family protein